MHVNLKVVYQGRPAKEKKCTRIANISPDIKFGLHRNTIENLRTAVLQRVFFVKRNGVFVPPFHPLSQRHFFHTMRKQLRFLCAVSVPTTPVSNHEFASMYKGRKHVQHMQSADSLSVRPVTRRDANIKCFGKSEKVNLSAKPNAIQRVVSPANDRYLVATGRYIKPVEKPLCHQIDKMFGGVTVMKGYNPEQIGSFLAKKWSRFKNPVCVGLDAERFDQHISAIALKWEHSVYNSIYKCNHLSTLLKWQLGVKAYGRTSDGWLKYKINGTRTSGCINTSLGNIIIMCSMLHAYVRARNVDVEVANNGDDSVVFMEREHLPRFMDGFSHWFQRMGFSMKIEDPVYELEKVQFCQTQPVCVDGKWRMLRDMPLSFAKDSISIKPLDSESVAKRWIHTVGVGGLTINAGVPIAQEFYDMYIRSAALMNFKKKRRRGRMDPFLSDPSLESGFMFMAHSMEYVGKVAVADSTRLSYQRAFGLNPTVQRGLEDFYKKFTIVYESTRHSVPVRF